MTEYVANFQEQVANSDESRKPLKESTKNWTFLANAVCSLLFVVMINVVFILHQNNGGKVSEKIIVLIRVLCGFDCNNRVTT